MVPECVNFLRWTYWENYLGDFCSGKALIGTWLKQRSDYHTYTHFKCPKFSLLQHFGCQDNLWLHLRPAVIFICFLFRLEGQGLSWHLQGVKLRSGARKLLFGVRKNIFKVAWIMAYILGRWAINMPMCTCVWAQPHYCVEPLHL